jgi:hypothetical protein
MRQYAHNLTYGQSFIKSDVLIDTVQRNEEKAYQTENLIGWKILLEVEQQLWTQELRLQ